MNVVSTPKYLTLCLFGSVAVYTFCYADVTKLSAEDRKILQDASRIHEIHTTTNLPPVVVALCADENGRLAGPGQKWEATDVISNNKLPRKRLIWAATLDEYYVVHYERGGIGHSYYVLVAVYKPDDKKASVVWRGIGDRFKDYGAFLTALKNNKLDDTRDYGH